MLLPISTTAELLRLPALPLPNTAWRPNLLTSWAIVADGLRMSELSVPLALLIFVILLVWRSERNPGSGHTLAVLFLPLCLWDLAKLYLSDYRLFATTYGTGLRNFGTTKDDE